jgi:rhodanese-related sulfurtransferase
MEDKFVISAAELAADTTYKIVDLRPWDERLGELGFIPASVRIDDDVVLLALCAQEPVALTCLSGKRSAARAAELRAVGARVFELDGGMLAWQAAGLPVCGLANTDAEIPQIKTLAEAPRKLAACFVAEQVELALDHGDEDLDAMAALRALFEAEGVRWDAPTLVGLHSVLDRAAEYSRRAGNPLARIAHNLDRYTAALRALQDQAG